MSGKNNNKKTSNKKKDQKKKQKKKKKPTYKQHQRTNFFPSEKNSSFKYQLNGEGLIISSNCFQGLMWVFLAVGLSWIDTYFVNLPVAKLHPPSL